jgi:ankyrin repeat protein
MKEREKERKESDAAINYLLLNNPPIVANPTAAELIESLCVACSKGEVGRARQILLRGVDVNGQSQDCTPAYIGCKNSHTECLSLLINHGAQLNKASNTGHTPAYMACQNGHVKILHLLIQHGADLSLADRHGTSPSHIASAFGRVKMLALIMKVNADLINYRDNQGCTPLLYVRQFGHDDAAEWLIEHGAEEAGEPLEGAVYEAIKVLSQLI